LNLRKYIIDKGTNNNNPSYLTNVAQAMQAKLRNSETFVFFKKSAIVKTNKKKYNEKLSPSNDISNSLGSTANKKLPNKAHLVLTNLLKIKKAGIIVIVDSIMLKVLCISIKCTGSEVSEKTKKSDKKFDHPELVVVYPMGKVLSKTVFIA
tara:strand:- start:36 stop:488 length:453 start_codon:yes stop_codon:yes gene_type:complete